MSDRPRKQPRSLTDEVDQPKLKRSKLKLRGDDTKILNAIEEGNLKNVIDNLGNPEWKLTRMVLYKCWTCPAIVEWFMKNRHDVSAFCVLKTRNMRLLKLFVEQGGDNMNCAIEAAMTMENTWPVLEFLITEYSLGSDPKKRDQVIAAAIEKKSLEVIPLLQTKFGWNLPPNSKLIREAVLGSHSIDTFQRALDLRIFVITKDMIKLVMEEGYPDFFNPESKGPDLLEWLHTHGCDWDFTGLCDSVAASRKEKDISADQNKEMQGHLRMLNFLIADGGKKDQDDMIAAVIQGGDTELILRLKNRFDWTLNPTPRIQEEVIATRDPKTFQLATELGLFKITKRMIELAIGEGYVYHSCSNDHRPELFVCLSKALVKYELVMGGSN